MRGKITRRLLLKRLIAASAALTSACMAMPARHTADAMLSNEDDTVYIPVLSAGTPPAPVEPLTNIFFMHHSVGLRMMQEANVRGLLYAKNSMYKLWDHGYNIEGLTLPDGKTKASYTYNIPNDYTHPVNYAAIFEQPYLPDPSQGAPANTFSGFLRHEVIIIKSCFDDSRILTDDKLEEYKSSYLRIRTRIDQFPNKLFLILTPPPLRECSANNGVDVRKRARAFANWLKSAEYVDGHPNLSVFDLFNVFAVADNGTTDANLLKPEYRAIAICDEHPNIIANQAAAPLFVNFIDQAIQDFASKS